MMAQKVMIAMTIGTPMKAPNRPHRKVPKKTANSTTVGDMASIAPDTRGSI